MHQYLRRPLNGGTQQIYRFENGFGASVIDGPNAYGNDEAPHELAVVQFRSADILDFVVTYETPITSDVEGYLDIIQVMDLLNQIEALEPARN